MNFYYRVLKEANMAIDENDDPCDAFIKVKIEAPGISKEYITKIVSETAKVDLLHLIPITKKEYDIETE